MRNATVAALIYEFLFDVHWRMEIGDCWEVPNENGEVHEVFSHNCLSSWEYSTYILVEVGALREFNASHLAELREREPTRIIQSPYYYPIMTLDECRGADFSAFETFGNYCYAMFTFEQFAEPDACVSRSMLYMSPDVLETVAAQDDIFQIDSRGAIFDWDRYEEKVTQHWVETGARSFRRVDKP